MYCWGFEHQIVGEEIRMRIELGEVAGEEHRFNLGELIIFAFPKHHSTAFTATPLGLLPIVYTTTPLQRLARIFSISESASV
jgi:hypothetical protein